VKNDAFAVSSEAKLQILQGIVAVVAVEVVNGLCRSQRAA